MNRKPAAWHCNCRKPLGSYKLNDATLERCPICGVARYSDPTLAKKMKLA